MPFRTYRYIGRHLAAQLVPDLVQLAGKLAQIRILDALEEPWVFLPIARNPALELGARLLEVLLDPLEQLRVRRRVVLRRHELVERDERLVR